MATTQSIKRKLRKGRVKVISGGKITRGTNFEVKTGETSRGGDVRRVVKKFDGGDRTVIVPGEPTPGEIRDLSADLVSRDLGLDPGKIGKGYKEYRSRKLNKKDLSDVSDPPSKNVVRDYDPSVTPGFRQNQIVLSRAQRMREQRFQADQVSVISARQEPKGFRERFTRMEETGEDVSTRTLGAGGNLLLDVVEGAATISKVGFTPSNLALFALDNDRREEVINFYGGAVFSGAKTLSNPMSAGFEFGRFASERPERFGLETIGMLALEGAFAAKSLKNYPNRVEIPSEVTITSRFHELKKTVLKGYEVSDHLLHTRTPERQTVLRPGGVDPAQIRQTPPASEFFNLLDIARRQPGQQKLYKFGYQRPLSVAAEEVVSTSVKSSGGEVQTLLKKSNKPGEELVVTGSGAVGRVVDGDNLVFSSLVPLPPSFSRSYRNLGGAWGFGSGLPRSDTLIRGAAGVGREVASAARLVGPRSFLVAGVSLGGSGDSEELVFSRDQDLTASVLSDVSVVDSRRERGFSAVSQEPVVVRDVFLRDEGVRGLRSDSFVRTAGKVVSPSRRVFRAEQGFVKPFERAERGNVSKRRPRLKPSFDLPDLSGEGIVGGGLFDVQVRRRGKFRTVASGLSAERAFNFGRRRTESTLAATFRLVPRSNGSDSLKSLRNDLEGFYRKDDFTFIEKRSRRIKTAGEKREIKRRKKDKGVFDELARSFRF